MKKNPSHETFFAEFALWLHTPLNKVLFARSLGINRFGVNKDKIGEVDPGFLLTAKSWVQEFLSETMAKKLLRTSGYEPSCFPRGELGIPGPLTDTGASTPKPFTNPRNRSQGSRSFCSNLADCPAGVRRRLFHQACGKAGIGA